MTPDDEVLTQTVSARARATATEVAAAGRKDLDLLLSDLERWVQFRTPTNDRPALDGFARVLAERLDGYGFNAELIPAPSGLHVHASIRGEGTARVVLLCHHDTVLDARAGTNAQAFRCSEGRAFGLGVADMKGGIAVAAHVGRLFAAGRRPFSTLELVSVPDEESRTQSPFFTLDRLQGCDGVLCMECRGPDGSFVSARKAARWVEISVHGRAAHAGVAPETGKNAVLSLCQLVVDLAALSNSRPDLTLEVTRIQGGENTNSVPASANATLDIRAFETAHIEEVIERIAEFEPADVTVALRDLGGPPAFERTSEVARLARSAVILGAELGESIAERKTGGVSDGSWTASLGIPTLDGLGPSGGADHSPNEFVEIASFPSSCGIVAGLVAAIDDHATTIRRALSAKRTVPI